MVEWVREAEVQSRMNLSGDVAEMHQKLGLRRVIVVMEIVSSNAEEVHDERIQKAESVERNSLREVEFNQGCGCRKEAIEVKPSRDGSRDLEVGHEW